VYLDDCIVFRLLKDHIETLWLMLDKCRQYKIPLNLNKCILCASFGIFLGHVVCKKGLLIDLAKIVVFVNFPLHTSIQKLRKMLGHIGYYKKFIKGYAHITNLIETLLNKEGKFQWNEDCQ
jgi:hypothetical protein